MCFLYFSLRGSVNKGMYNNNLITKVSKKIKEIIKEISDLDSSSKNEIKTKFIQKKICKEIYDYKEKVHIDNNMKLELRIMKEILLNPKNHK